MKGAGFTKVQREASVQDVRLSGARRLRVRHWEGTGRPLVLLHGLMDDSEGWNELALDTHRPCVAIDLPGFGGSDLPTRPRISAYAEAIVEGLDRLEIDGGTLVGHSLGGAVAAAVAERSPHVHALALLAPAGFGHIRLAEVVSLPGLRHVSEAALPLALVNPLAVTAAYSTVVAHRRLPSRDLMTRLQRRAFRSGPGVSHACQALAASGRSERAFFRRQIEFAGPVAALWGQHDALVNPGHAAALARSLPQAHVETWDGMGHHPQRERPAELTRFSAHHATKGRRSAPRRPAVLPLRDAA